jgi:hypothetical protein
MYTTKSEIELLATSLKKMVELAAPIAKKRLVPKIAIG